jgi:DNA-binding GntR family transcriptional regulator
MPFWDRSACRESFVTQNTDRKKAAAASVSEAIIREIIVQRYPPGMPLREQKIADRYRISRPSAREALRLAAQAGFVEIFQWRGARVIDVDIDQFHDIVCILEDIYAHCAALAAERMPDTAFAELDRLVPDDVTELPNTADKGKLYRLAFTIGEFIGQHSGSPIAQRMLLQVGRLVLWQQRLHRLGTVETDIESLFAHRLMAAAIKSRQPDVAAGAARAIVLITRQSLRPEATRTSGPATVGSVESIRDSRRSWRNR